MPANNAVARTSPSEPFEFSTTKPALRKPVIAAMTVCGCQPSLLLIVSAAAGLVPDSSSISCCFLVAGLACLGDRAVDASDRLVADAAGDFDVDDCFLLGMTASRG
jgi:hypothetical protein